MGPYLECVSCHEENKRGSARCARCGARLPANDAMGVDPELQRFLVEQERLRTQLFDERLNKLFGLFWRR